MPEPFSVLVMAAGHGTRMHSELPKVLHPVCGKPMVEWVIDAAREAGAERVVCVVRPEEGVAERLPEGVLTAEQGDGEGTGAAVLAGREAAGDTGTVVVLSGDHPLLSAELLDRLVSEHTSDGAVATVLTTEELDPGGYGRVVRAADGTIERIVETKDPSGVAESELAIREINIGTYAFSSADLWDALERVAPEGGERYLTGVFPLLRADGKRVTCHRTTDTRSAVGVNDRADLMDVERLAHGAILAEHARAGSHVPRPGLHARGGGRRDRRGHDPVARGHAPGRHARGCRLRAGAQHDRDRLDPGRPRDRPARLHARRAGR